MSMMGEMMWSLVDRSLEGVWRKGGFLFHNQDQDTLVACGFVQSWLAGCAFVFCGG